MAWGISRHITIEETVKVAVEEINRYTYKHVFIRMYA
ncbi:MAG: hypothetical protein ACI86C_000884 [Candidatus Latescibacterota bacterium]|jgi:hypothetical protein